MKGKLKKNEERCEPGLLEKSSGKDKEVGERKAKQFHLKSLRGSGILEFLLLCPVTK